MKIRTVAKRKKGGKRDEGDGKGVSEEGRKEGRGRGKGGVILLSFYIMVKAKLHLLNS